MTLKDRKSSDEMKNEIGKHKKLYTKGRLRSFGHVERLNKESWVKRSVGRLE